MVAPFLLIGLLEQSKGEKPMCLMNSLRIVCRLLISGLVSTMAATCKGTSVDKTARSGDIGPDVHNEGLSERFSWRTGLSHEGALRSWTISRRRLS